MRGILITIEGIEGCGKTTQAKKLFEWLSSFNIPSILTRDPGSTEAGDRIRELLLDGSLRLDEKTEVFLYLAARATLVEEVLSPALSQKKVVVLDRFADSFFAYQGYGRGIDLDWLKRLNEWATGGLIPDLTIVLDIPVEIGFERIRKTTSQTFDRIESEDEEFHRQVRQGFLSLAESEPERMKVIDASRSEEQVFEEIKQLVLPIINIPA